MSYNFVQIQERNYVRLCRFADFSFLEFQFHLVFRTDGWPKADIFVVLYVTGGS